jgi:hypothetical protein
VLPFSGSADLSGGDIAALYNGIFDAITSGTIALDLSACTTTNISGPANGAVSVSDRDRIAKITLPTGLTGMVVSAFNGFRGIKEVVFPETGLTAIPNSAFYGCAALTSITLPANLETIGNAAFYGSGLTSIVIPASVTSIAGAAFNNSAFLTDVTFLPAAPPTLGTGSFSGTNITAVHVLSGSLTAYTTTPGTAIAGVEGLPAANKWYGDAAP